MADGDELAVEHSIVLLFTRIIKMRMGGRHRITETKAIALTIVAWNAFRDGGIRSKTANYRWVG